MLGNSKIMIMVVIAVFIAVLVIVIRLRIRKSKENELRLIAEDKLRDQALNKALANNLRDSKTDKTDIESLPYEVDYDQNQLGIRNHNQDKIMLQITACSELSKRKFMLELKDSIKIGRAKDNPVVIKDPQALLVHCEIFRFQDEAYVRDFSGNRTILNRKKQRVFVDEKGLKLKTGDKLLIENTVLEIIIITKME